MSKKKPKAKTVPQEGRKISQVIENISNSLMNQIFSLLGKFGYPGIFSFVILFLVWNWASEAQKQELIDQFFLMKGWEFQGMQLLVIMIAFILILLGQHVHFRKRIKTLVKSLDKLKFRNAKLEGMVKGLQKRRVSC